MATNSTIYTWLEGFEEGVADIYFGFHQKFIQNPRLAKFWMEAALEELQHTSILRFCCENQLFSPVEINKTDTGRVTEMFEMVNVLANAPDLTVDLTFFAALIMESSGIEKIFRQLIQALAANHYVLYTAIEGSLRSHHEAFAQAALAFADDPALANSFRNLSNDLSL